MTSCAIGVATVSATTVALAPVWAAVTETVGGAISVLQLPFVSVQRIAFLPGAFGRCGKVTATAVKAYGY